MKKNKKNYLGAIAIAVVIAILVGSLGYLSSGFKNWKVKEWFSKEATTENIIGYDDYGNGLAANGVYSLPAAMTLTTIETGKTVTLTTTIRPYSAANNPVDWSLAFQDGTQNPTQYCTITPVSDGAATATLEFIKPAASPLTLTVKARETDVSASCQIDFITRYNVAGIVFNYVSEPLTHLSGETVYWNLYQSSSRLLIADSPVKHTSQKGTIEPVNRTAHIQFSFTEEFVIYMRDTVGRTKADKEVYKDWVYAGYVSPYEYFRSVFYPLSEDVVRLAFDVDIVSQFTGVVFTVSAWFFSDEFENLSLNGEKYTAYVKLSTQIEEIELYPDHIIF